MSKIAQADDVDIRKLEEVARDLEAEAARCSSVAAELRELIKRARNGAETAHVVVAHHGTKPALSSDEGAISVAVEVLRVQQKPLHMKELLPLVNERRARPSSRASLESGLTRALNSPKWRNVLSRTAPSTFAAH